MAEFESEKTIKELSFTKMRIQILLAFLLLASLGRSAPRFNLPFALFGDRVPTLFLSTEPNEKNVSALIPKSPVGSSKQAIPIEDLSSEKPLNLSLGFEDLIVFQTDHKSSCEIIRKLILNVTNESNREHYPSFVINLEGDNSTNFMDECGCPMIRGQNTLQFPYSVYSIYFGDKKKEKLSQKVTCGPMIEGSKTSEHIFIVPFQFPTVPQNFLQLEKILKGSLPQQRFLATAATSQANMVVPGAKTHSLAKDHWEIDKMSSFYMGATADIGFKGSLIDIGAGIGRKYLPIMHQFSQKHTKIVAFEPIPEYAEILEFHKYIYGWRNLEVIQAAVSPAYEKTLFIKNSGTQKYTSSLKEPQGQSIFHYAKTVNLDDFLALQEDGVLGIFIDVNGGEYELIDESFKLFEEDGYRSPSFVFVYFYAPKTPQQTKGRSKMMKKLLSQEIIAYLPRECEPLSSTELSEMELVSLVLVSKSKKGKYEEILCPRIQKSIINLRKQEKLKTQPAREIEITKNGGLYFERALTEKEKQLRKVADEVKVPFTQAITFGVQDSYHLAKALNSNKCQKVVVYDTKELSRDMEYTISMNREEGVDVVRSKDVDRALSFLNNQEMKTLVVIGESEEKDIEFVQKICKMKSELAKDPIIIPKTLCTQKQEL